MSARRLMSLLTDPRRSESAGPESFHRALKPKRFAGLGHHVAVVLRSSFSNESEDHRAVSSLGGGHGDHGNSRVTGVGKQRAASVSQPATAAEVESDEPVAIAEGN